MNIEEFRTPGQLIKALLTERGWTQQLLAIILGVDRTGLNHIVADRRPVTAEVAIRLQEVFDVPAENFLQLQKDYDLAMARIVLRPDPVRAMRAHLLGGLPILEMIKRGWVNATDLQDVDKIESELVNFFGVESVEQIEVLPHAAKKTDVFQPATPAQLAWIYRVKAMASEMLVPRYSPGAVREAIPKLQALLCAPEEARKAPRILAECGIRFVIVESLASARVDGVCFWLDLAKPVIGMTLRHDRIDNFWFVLRHELEHVLRQHGQNAIMLDTELEGEKAGPNVEEEERVANEAAADFCIPQARLHSFVARKSPFFREQDILGLANTLQIHPGLIAGQLQHKTGRYDRFRNHLVKIRHCILPSALIDGWGNIAPVDGL